MPTKIEWVRNSDGTQGETWNPVTGCSKVSQGCKHCYALREWPRLAANPKATAYFGREFTDVACHPERLDAPLRWTKPRKVFVNSMSDLFHEDVPDAFIDQVFAVMALAKRHTFQVLTKRPERMLRYMTRLSKSAKLLDDAARTVGYTLEFQGQYLVSWPIQNVWLGVSVEDQAAADERIPLLLRTPAAVRWISAEPLLGEVDLRRIVMPDGDALGSALYNDGESAGLDWVVVGGESGPKARTMHPAWVRGLRDQCAAAGVAFLMKQWGEWQETDVVSGGDLGGDIRAGRVTIVKPAGESDGHFRRGDVLMRRVGKKAAGRLLDGVLHDAYPTDQSSS